MVKMNKSTLHKIKSLSSAGLVKDGCPWCERIYDIVDKSLRKESKKSKRINAKKRKQYKDTVKTEQWVKDNI